MWVTYVTINWPKGFSLFQLSTFVLPDIYHYFFSLKCPVFASSVSLFCPLIVPPKMSANTCKRCLLHPCSLCWTFSETQINVRQFRGGAHPEIGKFILRLHYFGALGKLAEFRKGSWYRKP